MDTPEFIAELRTAAQELQADGKTDVPLTGLLAYLAQAEEHAGSVLEYRKLVHASSLAAYVANHDKRKMLFEAVMAMSQTVLRTALVINGGAAVALLAAMSNSVGKPGTSAFVHALAGGTALFGGGVLSAAGAAALAYVSQALYFRQPFGTDTAGDVVRVGCGLLVAGSFVAFGLGLRQALSAAL